MDMTVSDDGRVPREGVFANGTTAVAVVRFVLDYEGTARVEDVADYFHLEVDDVYAALAYCSSRPEEVLDAVEASRQ